MLKLSNCNEESSDNESKISFDDVKNSDKDSYYEHSTSESLSYDNSDI